MAYVYVSLLPCYVEQRHLLSLIRFYSSAALPRKSCWRSSQFLRSIYHSLARVTGARGVQHLKMKQLGASS